MENNNQKISSKRERFVKKATTRTNNVLKALKVLGNCANKNIYEYNSEDIDKIFKVVENKVIETKAKFSSGYDKEFRL